MLLNICIVFVALYILCAVELLICGFIDPVLSRSPLGWNHIAFLLCCVFWPIAALIALVRVMLRKIWRWLLARFRLSPCIMCKESVGKGAFEDYRDYPDNDPSEPMHFVVMKCKRCGKTLCMFLLTTPRRE